MSQASPQAEPAAPEHVYPLGFTASGSEYFRIWIVNLLLVSVTFGIYLPWAKVRRLQYFYSNTLLDGHALDFHGDPLRMLRGMLVAGAFFFVYSIAGSFSGLAALLAAVAFLCIWPLMVRASLRFRLANTSWRGLRLRFTGGAAGAYAAVLPPLALVLLPLSSIGLLDEGGGKRGILPPGLGIALAVCIGVFVLVSPWFFWRLKRYQHSHYALGQLVTGFRAGPGAFYGIALRTLGIVLLAALLVFGLVALGGLLGWRTGRGTAVLIAMGGFIVGVLFLNIVPKAYAVTRLQNLVWTQTGNAQLRFHSRLQLWPYARLQLRNFLLIAITLGFYWPFAVVANTRARIEAVALHTRLDLDALVGSAAGDAEATGDAAADLFGLDLGY